MALSNNPFFLLGVTCQDNRRTIVEKAEELSFTFGSDECSKAQHSLLNPSKRLAAEIEWFCDLNEYVIDNIKECISHAKEIPTDQLRSISKLNATIYNLGLSDKIDPFEMGYSILDIDEQYSKIEISEVTDILNECRHEANMVEVSDDDVTLELGKKREYVRQLITDKLHLIEDAAYIELVTRLAEKCIADDNYDEGVIISDVIDQYEIRMHSQIEKATESIKAHISRIKLLANDKGIEQNLNPLIKRIKEWDKLAQPLQLKSMASGMPHKISKDLGHEIRDLALHLHNEKGLSELALTLVNTMKDIFAEIQDIYDIFSEDAEALSDIAIESKEAEKLATYLDEFSKYSDIVKNNSDVTSSSITAYISKINSLDSRIKSSLMTGDLKVKLRENICYIARNVAIELHNTRHLTNLALSLATALQKEFADIPSLSSKLNDDITTLRGELYAQTQISARRAAQKRKNIVIVGIVLVIALIIGLSQCDSKSTSSNSYSQSQNNSTNNSSASTVDSSTKTKLEKEIDDLEADINSMETRLNSLQLGIDFMENELNVLSDDIDYYESQYYETGADTYYDSYYEAVDDYNSKFKDYSDAVDDYNALYEDYSEAIDDYNAKIKLYNNMN